MAEERWNESFNYLINSPNRKKSFNKNKFLIIFKVYVPYLRHRLINQKIKCKDGGSYFYKNQKYRPLKIEKKNFFIYVNSDIPNFSKMRFSENAKCFVGAFLQQI